MTEQAEKTATKDALADKGPHPLRLWINAGPEGSITIQGDVASLQKLGAGLVLAIQRQKEDGTCRLLVVGKKPRPLFITVTP